MARMFFARLPLVWPGRWKPRRGHPVGRDLAGDGAAEQAGSPGGVAPGSGHRATLPWRAVDDPDAGDRSAAGAVDRLLVDLARWMGDERAADAARSRTTERWLRQQVSDGARLAGVALDLAERRSPVVVRTRSGRVHRGALVAVASDFWVLATDAGHPCLLAATAVGSLRVAPDARGATWDPELTG